MYKHGDRDKCDCKHEQCFYFCVYCTMKLSDMGSITYCKNAVVLIVVGVH